jgi:hypothetical protein
LDAIIAVDWARQLRDRSDSFVLLGHPAMAQHAVVSRLPPRGRWAHQRRINHFSADPIRNRFWTMVAKINPYYGNFAWASLTAGYDWSRAGTIHDPRFF